MADVKINIASLGKEVLLPVPGGMNVREAFNEFSAFVAALERQGKIRDGEAGVNPPGATHEIARDEDGAYRLQRLGFD